jgi:hypothetical protein
MRAGSGQRPRGRFNATRPAQPPRVPQHNQTFDSRPQHQDPRQCPSNIRAIHRPRAGSHDRRRHICDLFAADAPGKCPIGGVPVRRSPCGVVADHRGLLLPAMGKRPAFPRSCASLKLINPFFRSEIHNALMPDTELSPDESAAPSPTPA